MLDKDEWLIVRVDIRVVEWMVWDNVDVGREIGFEGFNFGGFIGCLVINDCVEFSCCGEKC